jgi:hypothetical protein
MSHSTTSNSATASSPMHSRSFWSRTTPITGVGAKSAPPWWRR